MNNILVIGNGFDIAHGLKTKYSDFMEYIIEIDNASVLEEDDFKKLVCSSKFIEYFIKYKDRLQLEYWADFEEVIHRVVNHIILFMDNPTWEGKMEVPSKNRFTAERREILLTFNFIEKGDFGYKILPKYYRRGYGAKWNNIKNYLRDELDKLKKALSMYLTMQIRNSNSDIKLQQIENINPKRVISFNYTYTYKRYGISNENAILVHGSLSKNNIVLGYEDDSLNSIDDIYFKKYFQRIQNRTDRIEEKDFKTDELVNVGIGKARVSMAAHLYGLSLDITDIELIKLIYHNVTEFNVYYLDQNDYEEKVINLIKILGKEQFLTDYNAKRIRYIKIVQE